MMKFEGKICVVTGAASGIGRAVALQLIRDGAIVALSDIDEAGLAETVRLADAVTANHVRSDRLDVGDADAIDAYATMVKDSLGAADYIFNIAGMTRLGSFEETSMEAFEQVMNVNYWGVVRMSKAFLPQLMETKGGIANISSLFGFIGFPNQSHYCSSKFAVRGFSETLAQELADKGVSVTSVHPGGVDTGIVRNAILDGSNNQPGKQDEMQTRFKKAAITTPQKAAEIILNGVAKGKRRVVVGRDAKFLSFVQRLFPQSYTRFTKKLTEVTSDA